jgi:aryl-alcohol dehydrogenase-like predicted oxidoreductase
MNDPNLSRRDAIRVMGTGVAALAATNLSATANAAEARTSMLTRKIPATGEELPAIGLGTWQTFDVGGSGSARAPLKEVLAAFSALGGKLVDSSPMYGRSEEVTGDLTSELGLRPKLFVATKVWTTGRAAGVAQMEDSLRKLKADPIDLIQVHNLVDVDTHLATLRDWKKSGRVRYIGITHYTASQHAAVAKVIEAQPVDFVQINYSVGERDAERRLLPLAQDKGVAVIVNRPFSSGDLFARLRGKPLPAWAAEIGCESWAQILLKFILGHPAVTCAIPATSKVEHLRDNMKAGIGPLPDEALRKRIVAEIG